MPGTEKIVLGAVGDERSIESLHLENYGCVERVIPVLSPYKLASRELHPAETLISISKQHIGAPYFTVIAGPCSVENEEMVQQVGNILQEEKVSFMRGGAFKPRTSPYSFQGLGESGLQLMAKVRERFGTLIVTEVMDSEQVETVATYADVLQIGSRNMQNFTLLKKVGKTNKPILLKRGMAASIQEFLMSAEYILAEGNNNVILCERGIKTFETSYRNTLDLTAIPVLKEKTHLPVIVDPSHAAGNRSYVIALAKAAMACGADGIIVEIHPHPEEALTDGKQSLSFPEFRNLMQQFRRLAAIEGRILP